MCRLGGPKVYESAINSALYPHMMELVSQEKCLEDYYTNEHEVLTKTSFVINLLRVIPSWQGKEWVSYNIRQVLRFSCLLRYFRVVFWPLIVQLVSPKNTDFKWC